MSAEVPRCQSAQCHGFRNRNFGTERTGCRWGWLSESARRPAAQNSYLIVEAVIDGTAISVACTWIERLREIARTYFGTGHISLFIACRQSHVLTTRHRSGTAFVMRKHESGRKCMNIKRFFATLRRKSEFGVTPDEQTAIRRRPAHRVQRLPWRSQKPLAQKERQECRRGH